nr:hypothetical protein [Photorhabdus bodei]
MGHQWLLALLPPAGKRPLSVACSGVRRHGTHYTPATELAVIGAGVSTSPRTSALTGIKSVIGDTDPVFGVEYRQS